jgi:hypothetical protein
MVLDVARSVGGTKRQVEVHNPTDDVVQSLVRSSSHVKKGTMGPSGLLKEQNIPSLFFDVDSYALRKTTMLSRDGFRPNRPIC